MRNSSPSIGRISILSILIITAVLLQMVPSASADSAGFDPSIEQLLRTGGDNERTGKAVMLLKQSYGKQVNNIQIFNPAGVLIETITTRWVCPGRAPCVEFPDPRLRGD